MYKLSDGHILNACIALNQQLFLMGIGMVAVWPYAHYSPIYILVGYFIGSIGVVVNAFNHYRLFGVHFSLPHRLLLGMDSSTPKAYAWEINHAMMPSDYKYDAFMAGTGLMGLLFATSLYYTETIWTCCALIAFSLFPSMHLLRIIRCIRRKVMKATCAWYVDARYKEELQIWPSTKTGRIFFWVLPSLERFAIPLDDDVKLVLCAPDASQSRLAYAISDRSPSLYLVSRCAVIPLCCDSESNQSTVDQLVGNAFKHDIQTIVLDENPIPKPAADHKIAFCCAALFVVICVLIYGLYLATGAANTHGSRMTSIAITPLLSIMATWGVLELYSMKLRKLGHNRLKEAAGLS